MKLLIITQKVDINDDVLGFFHRWIEELAKYCEKVTVICLQQGECHLPKNIKVLSLGKEKYFRKRLDLEKDRSDGKRSDLKEKIFSRMKYLLLFYKYIWQERKNYDAVFVHMNPEYVVFGGIFWRLLRKIIGLWYVHRQVNIKLKIAEKLADEIFTVTKESFNLKSKKINIVGHGIDPESFLCEKINKASDKIKILYVGRIAPIKNVDILIEAAKVLRGKWDKKFEIKLVGPTTNINDEEYFKRIKSIIYEYGLGDFIKFAGSVQNKKIKEFYCDADILINLSPGGLSDKVVFEAMFSKTPVLVSNVSFKEFFGNYSEKLVFKEGDPDDLAEKIMDFFSIENEVKNAGDFLFLQVNKKANLKLLIPKILNKLQCAQ